MKRMIESIPLIEKDSSLLTSDRFKIKMCVGVELKKRNSYSFVGDVKKLIFFTPPMCPTLNVLN